MIGFFFTVFLGILSFSWFGSVDAHLPRVSIGQVGHNQFLSISYHDCQADDAESFADTLTPEMMNRHFQWLKANGYTAIGIEDLEKAKAGKKDLPSKAVLLTFDDGYASFYSVVYPLLKAYGMPAVLALVGKWMETPQGQSIYFGKKIVERSHFLTWPQVQEMQKSGLVEIASHSYDHHRGVLANPQGNQEPAYTTPIYDPQTNQYESQEAYRQRVGSDMEKNNQLLRKKLGKAPRVIVWPYGEYNAPLLEIAARKGFRYSITLNEGVNDIRHQEHQLMMIGRVYGLRQNTLGDWIESLDAQTNPALPMVRFVKIDLDEVYDPDPLQRQKNVDRLISRIYQLKINAVFLKGFSSTQDQSSVQSLYFSNRHLPVKADFMDHIAWQLETRAQTRVYALMPWVSFQWPSSLPTQSLSSLEAPGVKKKIREIFEDLSLGVRINGIVFEDPSYWSQRDLSVSTLEALGPWIQELSAILRVQEKTLKTVLSLPADEFITFLDKQSSGEERIQCLGRLSQQGVTYLSLQCASQIALLSLLDTLSPLRSDPQLFHRILFDLYSPPGGSCQGIFSSSSNSKNLLEEMRSLSEKGVRSFGYTDRPLQNDPAIETVKEGISIQQDPFLP